MSGPRPGCRLLRDLAAEDRLLLSPELRELRRVHPQRVLRAGLRAVLAELGSERGMRSLAPARIDLEMLRSRLERRLERSAS